ncbi:sodium-coupled monocarboxylate transporter 1-like [Oppia nitens]|uniref:sodium-coupled monocarboxylate transporter 1-like n=1 Tax=Oppia nitens TaxID=1686743 RepID=UPI0023DB6F3A|nr:sodium-coupled monocarboxylate transporter 1-like [Oppia nitens]
MLSTNFSIIDYLVFGFLLTASSLIGVYFWWITRNNATNSEFLTGDRKLGMFPVTLSLVASFMSTNTILGAPAEVFQVGTQFLLQNIAIVLSIILAAEVFMPIYYKLDVISIHEYLSQRFNSKYIRLAGTVGFLLATVPYMAVVLYGPSLALSSVTPLSIPTCILVVGLICTFYTSIGGIKAVIWTDVLQCILMFLGVLMVIIQGIIESNGLSEIWRINEEGGRLIFFNFKFDLYNHNNIWNVVFGTIIYWTAVYCVMQTQVQRYCSMKSPQYARRTLYWNLPGLIIFAGMSIMCGTVLYAKYHGCDPLTLGLIERHDQLMPYFVMDTLAKYPGLPGLFVACVFSGSLSTLSSGFNALAAVTWEDLIKDHIKLKNEKQVLTVTKIIAMCYGLLAIAMSFGVGNLGTVLQACMALVGSMVGPILGLYLLGIFYRRATAPGVLIAFILGVLISLSLSIGSLVVPRPKVSLPTTLDNCPDDVIQYAHNKFGQFLPNSTYLLSYDNPEGIAKFFHISYLILSIIGFVVTLVLGIILSLCIGKPVKTINEELMFSFKKANKD